MSPSLRFGTIRVGPLMLLLGVTVHLLFPAFFLLIAYALDRWFGWSLGWRLGVRLAAGGALLILSVIVEVASTPQFFRAGGTPSPFQPTDSLVVSGPYRYCRHPIYLAYTGYVLGLGIMLGLFAAWIASALMLLCLAAFALVYEEPALRRRFGEQFERYRRTTPFMIPRFTRRRTDSSQ